ncbi:putative leucine-rich repeat receptor-like protein kinase At2g19210 [Bidens hawaiensis]|uniref:putative leucine-rich repeat receptor-like protein kinase At2g19210 n=1 Tax=Bidens hawaiensis TaxID=980011 RepID=UPI00404B9EE9
MKVLRIFFPILVLHVAAMIYAQDDQSGFISIDCGIPQGSHYTDNSTGINYVSDYGFIDAGVTQDIQAIQNNNLRVLNTIRSFPVYKRNCYTLRPQNGKNNRYLIRAIFYYDESRGEPPQFDLFIGADYWATVTQMYHELIHLASSDYIHVCLVNTDQGVPFITALELRLLNITMYEEYQSPSLILQARYSLATNEMIRLAFLIS